MFYIYTWGVNAERTMENTEDFPALIIVSQTIQLT